VWAIRLCNVIIDTAAVLTNYFFHINKIAPLLHKVIAMSPNGD
jgi:hypothetical protein